MTSVVLGPKVRLAIPPRGVEHRMKDMFMPSAV